MPEGSYGIEKHTRRSVKTDHCGKTGHKQAGVKFCFFQTEAIPKIILETTYHFPNSTREQKSKHFEPFVKKPISLLLDKSHPAASLPIAAVL